MKRAGLLALAIGMAAFASWIAPATAFDPSHVVLVGNSSSKGAKVRGYVKRRGGYSYSYEDAINTYGDSRGSYGRADSLRDPFIDRQTNSGPFDHGFFFDSGIAPRGGDSPYLN